MGVNMDFTALKDKANSLPLAPGVYIMKDKSGAVIYVGKAKKLKNRVSQYFVDTVSHSPKTRAMVSKIHEFDVIVAASEFEALVLECSLIKRHLPKYNILLKDDKGYPYVRLDMQETYPVLEMVKAPADDGALYYGPFGSRGVTNSLINAIRISLKLPGCSKKFPRDIGKDRPCLNYHMNQCDGWCQCNMTAEDYRDRMEQVRQILQGNYKIVTDQIKTQMLAAAEELNFELAAGFRDRLNAVEALQKRQLVAAGRQGDTDVIGFAQTETKACFVVLHFADGNLLDKDIEILPAVDDAAQAVSSLLMQYYFNKGFAPRNILVSQLPEDAELIQQLLEMEFSVKTKFFAPQRGDKLRLIELAYENALQEAVRLTTKEEKLSAGISKLREMLRMDSLHRIEAFDISNIAGTDIVASMTVHIDGKPARGEYKRFKIQDLENQDDYASMHQVVKRRFMHYNNQDSGFAELPDILFIDGGIEHSRIALSAVQECGLNLPVFGMVKDDRHRTRALVTPDGELISIDANQAVFSLVGTIQEETHRFAISYHRNLRSKRLRYSELDKIPGIGPKRKQLLLKHFQSIQAISAATLADLERYLPADAANAVFEHFKEKRGE